MNPADLKAGVTVLVPAGADSARRQPYRLAIAKVAWIAPDGRFVQVEGTVQRLDGTPTRRKFEHRFVQLPVAKLEVVPSSPPEKTSWKSYGARRLGNSRYARWHGTVLIEREYRRATSIMCDHGHADKADAERCAADAAARWTAAGERGTFDPPEEG